MLRQDRLWADLLSSMPLCFNLFSDLHDDVARARQAVSAWWPDAPPGVAEVRFEWSPGRLDPLYLGNRSAFDAAMLLDLDHGAQGVIGIETKYHEHAVVEARPKPERLRRYREVTEQSEIFSPGASDRIIGTDLQQIWLDHLLVLAMLQHPRGTWSWGRFVLVYPAGNTSFATAAARYRALLTDVSTFDVRTIEELIAHDAFPAGTRDLIRERYLW